MFKLLTAVVLLGTAANAFPGSLVPDGRIVGGEATDISSYPWLVSLRFLGIHKCSGALISPTWVLTAAHCVDSSLVTSLTTVNVGSNYMSSGGTECAILRVVIHPSYYSVYDDIALIELATSVSLGANVAIATLPSQGTALAAGDNISITGWDRDDAEYPYVTGFVTEVIPSRKCGATFSNNLITENMFCAGGLDACMGDSGAPAVVKGELYGVMSWGYGCANSSYPGVYTNVGMYSSWISQTTGI